MHKKIRLEVLPSVYILFINLVNFKNGSEVTTGSINLTIKCGSRHSVFDTVFGWYG